MMPEIHPIRTEADYQAALVEIESLFDAELNTPECDRLEVLATLVEAYEQQHYPIKALEPQEYLDDLWDKKIAADLDSGKLDKLIAQAEANIENRQFRSIEQEVLDLLDEPKNW